MNTPRPETLNRSGVNTLVEYSYEGGRKVRTKESVKYQSTRLPNVVRIYYRVHGTGFYPIHVDTGRALHLNPMSWEQGEYFIDELLECPIELERVHDYQSAQEYYVRRLSDRAMKMVER